MTELTITPSSLFEVMKSDCVYNYITLKTILFVTIVYSSHFCIDSLIETILLVR